jgi:hypothetical protein
MGGGGGWVCISLSPGRSLTYYNQDYDTFKEGGLN